MSEREIVVYVVIDRDTNHASRLVGRVDGVFATLQEAQDWCKEDWDTQFYCCLDCSGSRPDKAVQWGRIDGGDGQWGQWIGTCEDGYGERLIVSEYLTLIDSDIQTR